MRTRTTCPQQRHTQDEGFTLVEIMVVVIILGILAATIVPQFIGVTQNAKVSQARGVITTLAKQIELFNLDYDRYPTTEEGLQALVTPPVANGQRRAKYIKELLPDPWGNPYRYVSPGSHSLGYDLWSMGADGTDGGEGDGRDITNWTEK